MLITPKTQFSFFETLKQQQNKKKKKLQNILEIKTKLQEVKM